MANPETKAVWPGWETVRLIGRGSFGAVYEIERRIGVPITYVSNGPSREDIIKREPKI